MKSVRDRSSYLRFLRTPRFRVTALGMLVAALLFGLGFRTVDAQLDETMLSVGARVMSYPGTLANEPRTIEVNGVRVSFRTQVVAASLSEALAHYQQVCSGSSAPSMHHASLLSTIATRSRRTSHDGYVACVDLGRADLPTLAQRVFRFIESWDLADVGALRYAYAQRTGDRGDERTHVVTLWSDRSLDLRRLLPLGEHDAEGSDPADLDRLPRSRRLLAAREKSGSAGVYVYRVTASSGSLLEREYRQMLKRRGWRPIERHPHESIEVDGTRMLSAEKGVRMVTALVHDDGGESVLLTLLTSGADE